MLCYVVVAGVRFRKLSAFGKSFSDFRPTRTISTNIMIRDLRRSRKRTFNIDYRFKNVG